MGRLSIALRHLLCAALLVAAPAVARGQCPDGTPPPCAASRLAAQRANPPVDSRAWIVVPFGNATRSADLDWLRDASVNLLALDLSRWNDIRVVPDKRVADLVRESAAARSGEALTLSNGLAVARRAGAAMLVMGDYYKLGSGVRIVASVFDVRTGARVRSVTQQVSEPDSLLTAFSPLARNVLAVAPPADARMGDLGTHRLDAYRSYLLGEKSLNRFNLADAREHLTHALALDSSFALAHLAFSLMLEWDESADGTQAMAHALAAQRLGTNLPRRERMLIDAGVARASGDFVRLCAVARTLVAQDSTDIQGVFLVGECSFHDDGVVVSSTDSMVGTYRGNWNTAIRAFRRVIALDPSYLGAFEHVIDVLQRTRRNVIDCPPGHAAMSCTRWIAYVLRSGDSLEVVPVRPANATALAIQARRYRVERPRIANHVVADSIAREWVAADPTSEGARAGLARVALMRGNLPLAAEQLTHVSSRATGDNHATLRMKLEVAGKLGHGAEARAISDSIMRVVARDSSSASSLPSSDLMLGRIARFDRSAIAETAAQGPIATAYARQVGRALLGIPRDEMARDEAAFYATLSNARCDVDCRLALVAPTLLFSLHVPFGEWPDLTGGTYSNHQFDAARALALRDTSLLRRTAVQLEADGRANVGMTPANWAPVLAADAYLALQDSVSALRMARFFVDTAMVGMNIASDFVSGVVVTQGAGFWPRMMLMRADLAAAAGQRDEARRWYTAVLDLWGDADPELELAVNRVRASLARVGTPPMRRAPAADGRK